MKTLKLSLVAAALAAIFSLAACGNNAPSNQAANAPNVNASIATRATPAAATPTPDAMAVARADFKNTCARCHKEDGTGGVKEDEDGGKFKVPNFHEGHGAEHTVEQMVKTITNGHERMPAFGKRLPPERIEALARFISQEFQGQPAAPGH